MPDSARLEAPAKINIHLAVGAPRPDGFHGIASIFQAISLADSVTVSRSAEPGIRIVGDCGCRPEDNTCYRAAQAFLGAVGGASDSGGLDIAVDKRIPMGAGLGGGSSDAAATLRCLDRLFPGAVSAAALRALAAGIGSDVPFFLGEPCAAVTGRGDRLSPLVPRLDYALVVVDPGFPVSTKEAYGALDEARAAGSTAPALPDAALAAELEACARSYAKAAPSAWRFRNDFFGALCPRFQGLAPCLDAVRATGALFSAMTGSGSAFFGVFATPDAAMRAAKRLVDIGYSASYAFPLA